MGTGQGELYSKQQCKSDLLIRLYGAKADLVWKSTSQHDPASCRSDCCNKAFWENIWKKLTPKPEITGLSELEISHIELAIKVLAPSMDLFYRQTLLLELGRTLKPPIGLMQALETDLPPHEFSQLETMLTYRRRISEISKTASVCSRCGKRWRCANWTGCSSCDVYWLCQNCFSQFSADLERHEQVCLSTTHEILAELWNTST